MPEIAQDLSSPAEHETAQDLSSPAERETAQDLSSPAERETAQDFSSPAEREADTDIQVSVDVGCVFGMHAYLVYIILFINVGTFYRLGFSAEDLPTCRMDRPVI